MLARLPFARQLAPLEKLICVQRLPLRYACHGCARNERLSSFFFYRPAATSPNACFEVSTYPSWALTLVSTKSIFLIYRNFVETVINGRLRFTCYSVTQKLSRT